jgi:Na+-transporting methylmalonyl-CoA/oxaloacetate decarboxylase gamma subunit
MGLSATALVISAFGAFAQDAAKPVTPAAKAKTTAPAATATATKKDEVKKVTHAKVKAKKAAAPAAM